VSDAVVAAALISRKLQDEPTWHFSLTNKLDQWIVRACFWDVHVPYSSLSPAHEDFHKALIMAARELDMGPVCVTGHANLVSIVHDQYLIMKAAVNPVRKKTVDCLASVFMVRHNFDLLYQTLFSDSLDGFSIPLISTPPNMSAWTPQLRALGESSIPIPELHKAAIVAAATPYCWMLVAAYHLLFPDHSYPVRATWTNVFIIWDEAED